MFAFPWMGEPTKQRVYEWETKPKVWIDETDPGPWIKAYAANPPDTDECIMWPFGRKPDGYARANNPFTGKQDAAYRVIYEAVNDGEPFPADVARHKYGCGPSGCVNHRHIVPGTRSDNALDMFINGVTRVAKLTASQAEEIGKRLDAGESRLELAFEYHVSEQVIARIDRGQNWWYVTGRTRRRTNAK